MRRNKLLFILIPVVLCVILLAVGGYVYLKLNSKPSKIFNSVITKVFSFVETEEEKYYTAKTNLELSARVESAEADDEEIQEINDALEKSKITINSQVDNKNLISNNNVKVVYDDENILDLTMLIQDEKIYVAVLDWLDKYIEIPLEGVDFEEIKKQQDKNLQIDVDLILKAVEKELTNEIEKQEFTQAKTSLNIDGKEVKVTKTSLTLDITKAMNFEKEFLTNLKTNVDFQMALGQYKEDVLETIDEILEYIEDTETHYHGEDKIVFSIYTKGLLNKFVAAEVITNDSFGESGTKLLKKNTGIYEFTSYNDYDGTKKETSNILVENKKETKTKGTLIITIKVGNDNLVITCDYEKKENKTEFKISTNVEETLLTISGDFIKSGEKYNGNWIFKIENSDFGSASLNCLYEIVLNEDISKVNIENKTTLDELTEEDQEELMANIQNSKMYEIIQDSGLLGILDNGGIIGYAEEKAVTYENKKIAYDVPEDFEGSSYSGENSKTYLDDNLNSVTIFIDNMSAEEYLEELGSRYILTSSYYENQQISDTNTYTVGEKEYKYRSITYKDEFAEYINLYFVHEFEDGYIYVVEVEIENNTLPLDKINKFLTITVK